MRKEQGLKMLGFSVIKCWLNKYWLKVFVLLSVLYENIKQVSSSLISNSDRNNVLKYKDVSHHVK